MPLNHNEESVIKALIRLTNRRIHQYIDDGGTRDFSGFAVDFFFSDTAIRLSTEKMQSKTVIATLDDLLDLKLVISQNDYRGNMVFQLSDTQKRLDKATKKEAERYE